MGSIPTMIASISRATMFLLICSGPVKSAPVQIICAYDPFVAGAPGPVVQRLSLTRGAYVDADFPDGPAFEFSEDRAAVYLIHTVGGAITAFAIEKSDGTMLKISAATFGTVQHSRGRCRFD